MTLIELQEYLWYALAVLLMLGITLGLLKGFARVAVWCFNFLLAGLATMLLLDDTAGKMPAMFPQLDDAFAPLVAYSILWVGSLLLVFSITWLLLRRTPPSRALAWPDRVAGLLPGIIVSALISFHLVFGFSLVPNLLMQQRILHANPVFEKLYATAHAMSDGPQLQTLSSSLASDAPLGFARRPDFEAQLLAYVQYERQRRNLPAFNINNTLVEAGSVHVIDMHLRKYFAHNSPEGATPFDRLKKLKVQYAFAGENLAHAPSVEAAHKGLMESPGHRANLLNPNFRQIGIAIIRADNGQLMIAQEFMD